MDAGAERVFTVEGMSCEHCRAAVASEVSAVPGVRSVDVDLAAGTLRVAGTHVDEVAVAAAVAEAGYTLR